MRKFFKPTVLAVITAVMTSWAVTPAFAAPSVDYTKVSAADVLAAKGAAAQQDLRTDEGTGADIADPVEMLASARIPHGFDVAAAIAQAQSEIGKTFPTGWNQQGECIMSVMRWIKAGGGTWGSGNNPVSNYNTATRMSWDAAEAGDVIQYENIENPTAWLTGVHTVFIIGKNADGTFQIIEANNPGGSGLVSRNDHWTPNPPEGFRAVVWRF